MSLHSPASQPVAVRLRPALRQDALCLSVLALQVFLDTYATQGVRPALAREVLARCSEQRFAAWIADPDTRIDVAEREGHLVGFAQVSCGSCHEQLAEGPQAELLRLYVQERFTGQHLGTALLQRAEDRALASGAAVLWLKTWVHNHRAHAFYGRRGYHACGLTHDVYEGETHDNHLLFKRLQRAA